MFSQLKESLGFYHCSTITFCILSQSRKILQVSQDFFAVNNTESTCFQKINFELLSKPPFNLKSLQALMLLLTQLLITFLAVWHQSSMISVFFAGEYSSTQDHIFSAAYRWVKVLI